eukprot:3123414-Rhodomonas_salina.1
MLLEELGFTFNEKLQPPAQLGEFIGMGWDTLNCTFWMSAVKANKIAGVAESMVEAGVASRLELAKLQGKLVWFSACLHATLRGTSEKLLSSARIRPDRAPSLGPATALQTQADHELPFWLLQPAQLYKQYLQGKPVVQAMLETDASVYCWGCTLKVLEGSEWVTYRTSVRWKAGEQTIQGQSVLHVTDCEPTLDLPDSCSARSQWLQQTVLAVWTLMSSHCIFLSSVWAPGYHMIKSGTDALSREYLQDPHDAAIDDVAWERVLALACRAALTLRVDWFADSHNHCLPEFWGCYTCPESAGTDTLSAPSWDHSYCQRCPAVTSHAGFFFPLFPLLYRVAAKAKQDRAAGIIVLPSTVSSVWWPVFAAAAICPPVQLHAFAVNTRQGSDPHSLGPTPAPSQLGSDATRSSTRVSAARCWRRRCLPPFPIQARTTTNSNECVHDGGSRATPSGPSPTVAR